MEVKYVLVEVFNEISTPAVTYNKDTNTVTMAYKLFQFSKSRYVCSTEWLCASAVLFLSVIFMQLRERDGDTKHEIPEALSMIMQRGGQELHDLQINMFRPSLGVVHTTFVVGSRIFFFVKLSALIQ